MPISPDLIEKHAQQLDTAAVRKRELPMFADQVPGMELADAYLIQSANVRKRYERGDRRIGVKMGLTSKAKMQQMGVSAPIRGILTASMEVEDGGKLPYENFIHPKVEPEIAFVMAKDLRGPASEAQIREAIKGACAAMEILDSRFANFKFTLKDVIADNCSSAAFVVSNHLVGLKDNDLNNLGMVLEINGKPAESGSSAAILDHPLKSLAELVRMLAESGDGLKAGEIVLAGAATAAVALRPGDRVETKVQDLGSVSFQVTTAQKKI